MNDEELKRLWQSQTPAAPSPVDSRAQIEAMRTKMLTFRRSLNRASFIELAIRAFIILIFGVYFFTIPYPVTRLGALIVIVGELFVAWRLNQTRKLALYPDTAAPVNLWLQQEREWLHDWAHDVKPFRKAFWEDLLPLWPGVNLFLWGFPNVNLGVKFVFTAFYTLILALSYWLQRYSRPRKALPLEDELDALLQGESPNVTQTGNPYSPPAAAGKRNRAKTAWIIFAVLIAVISVVAAVFNSFNDSSANSPLRSPPFDDISAFNEADLVRIDAWLQEQFTLGNYPSLSIAIVRRDAVVYRRSFGFEDIKAGRKATPETSYHVASVTKAFTASIAAILHARGVIDLDQPVAKYLPAGVTISTRPAVGATITLRQLASHTSGLPRGVAGPVQSVEGRYQLEPQRLYDHLAKAKLQFDPGADELYSNLGFGLLGHALELAAGKPFDLLLQETICDPLQLEHTAINENDKLRIATGYSSFNPRWEEKHSYRERLAGSGGLITSAADLAKFLSAQLKPGFFTTEMLEELHTPAKLANGSNADTALGWNLNFSSSRIIEKNGGRNNCSAWIGFSRDHGIGIAVLANCGEPGVDPIGRWLLERTVPGGRKPVMSHGYAKVTPYTGVRWKNDRPIVQVNGRWADLVSINGIPIERIMEFAQREFRDKARKRFAEDLVYLLSLMGHDPDWEVTLGLKTASGQVEHLKVRMTEENRRLSRGR